MKPNWLGIKKLEVNSAWQFVVGVLVRLNKMITKYNVSPFPRDVEVRRSDVAMNPFIFLLKNNGQSILFISILGVD